MTRRSCTAREANYLFCRHAGTLTREAAAEQAALAGLPGLPGLAKASGTRPVDMLPTYRALNEVDGAILSTLL
jgi:hypothetical protein